MENKHDYDVIERKRRAAECIQMFLKEKGSTVKSISEKKNIHETTVRDYLTNKELMSELYGSVDGKKVYLYCQKKFELLRKTKNTSAIQEPEQKRRGRL